MLNSIGRELKFAMQLISDEMLQFWHDNFDWPSRPSKNKQSRPLTEEDRLGWDTALNLQPRGNPRTFDSVRIQMRARNPVRFWQMQRDMRWLERQMKKAGYNPEDARFLL
jgi:hypothetical protein